MPQWREWRSASESDWSAAMAREAVIRPLAEHSRLTRAAVDEAALQLGLSRTSIYRMVRRFKQRPQTSSLLPWKRGRDQNRRMLDPARENLIASCISEFYLTKERPSM